jgi:tRNA delta(2)-isopentenylpyrophosphate transferase
MQNSLGQKNFYSKLLKNDSSVKNRIDPTDVQRSIRAYEVISFTKKSIFEWYKKTKPSFQNDQFIKIYIDYPRDELISKISKRVDQMMKNGAIQEVKDFLKLNLKSDNNIFKVIGIREIKEFIDKKTSMNDLKQNIVIKTRQYAKRQRTWSRGQMNDWLKFDAQALLKFINKL